MSGPERGTGAREGRDRGSHFDAGAYRTYEDRGGDGRLLRVRDLGAEVSEGSTSHCGRATGRKASRDAANSASGGNVQESPEGDEEAARGAIGVDGMTA